MRLARALPRPDDRLDQRRGHRPHRRDAQQTRHAGRDSIRRLPRHRAFGGHVLWTYTARMVSRAAPALTSIGFRRDIKYFLATYVGLLICIIMILLALLQANTADVEDSMREQWNVVADAAAAVLSNTPGEIDVTT